jgi:hypothetical protein
MERNGNPPQFGSSTTQTADLDTEARLTEVRPACRCAPFSKLSHHAQCDDDVSFLL